MCLGALRGIFCGGNKEEDSDLDVLSCQGLDNLTGNWRTGFGKWAEKRAGGRGVGVGRLGPEGSGS